MYKWLYVFLIFIISFMQSYGQKDTIIFLTQNDYILLGSSIAMGGTSLYLNHTCEIPTYEEFISLDIESVAAIDRQFLGQSEQWKLISDVGLAGSFLLPTSILGTQIFTNDSSCKYLALQYFESTLLTASLTSCVKNIVRRPRPLVYYTDNYEELEKDDFTSFFSGHTSITANNFIFSYLKFAELYPDSKWRIPVMIISFTAPGVVGYARMQSNKHFLSDVATGYLVGGMSAYMAHYISQKKNIFWIPSTQKLGFLIIF